MRVPYTIPVNTLRAYAASDQTLLLMGERFRQIRAEDLLWDERVPDTLAQICLQTLASNFAQHYEVLPFLPQFDLDYLLVILSPDLPLDLVAPIISDGIYWKRRCEFRWQKQPLDISIHSDSWKIMYIERHVQEFIHYQEPGYIDWDDVTKVMNVCSPFLNHLVIRELKPPRNILPEIISPDECLRGDLIPDHIDLSKVIKYLNNLHELSIKFGVLNIGMKYSPNVFKISLNDINNLSNGLLYAKYLKILRIHRCNIDDAKVNIVLNALTKLDALETLEISHCKLRDNGAKAIGQFMLIHKNLNTLLIQNNYIRSNGALGLAFALKSDECCPLKVLDLQFNLIKDQGAISLSSAITKNNNLQELYIGGAGIKKDGGKKIAESLLFTNSIQKIELCNNHFDESIADSFIYAVQNNKKLYTLDIRNCGLGSDAETMIHKYISRNRQIYRSSL